jgi:hypothetical protein
MRIGKSLINVVAIAAAIMTLARCSETPVAGGGNSSDVPNALCLSGTAVTPGGAPAEGAYVDAYDPDFNPALYGPYGLSKSTAPISYATRTDAQGHFLLLLPIDKKSYHLLIQGTNGFKSLRPDIVFGAAESLSLPDDTLLPAGNIRGVTYMPGLDSLGQVRCVIYIPGTPFVTKPDICGAFTLDGLPAGTYRIIIDPAYAQYGVTLIDRVVVTAGQTSSLDTVRIVKTSEAPL